MAQAHYIAYAYVHPNAPLPLLLEDDGRPLSLQGEHDWVVDMGPVVHRGGHVALECSEGASHR